MHRARRLALDGVRARDAGQPQPEVRAQLLACRARHRLGRLAGDHAVGRGHLAGNAVLDLCLRRVGHQAPAEVVGGAGNVRDSTSNRPACRGLHQAQRQPAVAQQPAHAGRQRVLVLAPDVVAQQRASLLVERVDQPPRLGAGRGLRADPDVHPVAARVEPDRGVRRAQQRRQQLVDQRLAVAGRLQRVRDQDRARAALQLRRDPRRPHVRHLRRRAGHQHDHAPVSLGSRCVLDPPAGRRAARVRDRARRGDQPGLLHVALDDGAPAVAEASLQHRALRGIDGRRLAEHGRHRLAGHVVLGRSEAARRERQVGALPGAREHLLQPAGVVADLRDIEQIDAVLRQLRGDERRVGVDDLAEQDLRADRDDLRAHRCCPLVAPRRLVRGRRSDLRRPKAKDSKARR